MAKRTAPGVAGAGPDETAPSRPDETAPSSPDETAPSSPDETADSASPTGDRAADRPRDPFASPLAVVPTHHYQLGGEHARGGLGRVLRGRDQRLDRPVAIKELLRETTITRARFMREARITARLQHPGVVPIYEAGVWPNGQPFYAMRLVAGKPLSEAITACKSLADRLGLLARVLVVAETMAYAHSQDIIHRDLKPANVLVGDYGETVVIDWGIAKQIGELDSDLPPSIAAVEGDLTAVGQVMGTPWYMAPEQARGEPTDTRADVYALGAILYHLLAGVPPHAGTTNNVVEVVASGEVPPPLSTRMPGIPADLLTLVDKAIAVDPAARYPTAAELAADLKRFLTGQLVTVHRYTLGALIKRWIERHRAAVAVGAAALATVAVVGGVSIANVVAARDDARRQQILATKQGELATSRADELAVQRNELILTQAQSALDRDPTEALAWLKRYPESGTEWPRVRSIAADAISRGVSRHVLEHDKGLDSAATSADGSRVATVNGHDVAIWDAITGARIAAYPHNDGAVVVISPDGRVVVSVGFDDPVPRRWSGADRPVEKLEGHRAPLSYLTMVGDGTVVAASQDGTVCAWAPTQSSPVVMSAHVGDVHAIASFHDGSHLATTGADRTIRVWDVTTGTGRMVATASAAPQRVTVSPDDKNVAVAIADAVWIWPVDGGPGRRLGAHAGDVTALAFVNSDLLASAGKDQAIRLWGLTDGKQTTLLGHDREVRTLAASATGWIASGDAGGGVRVWRPDARGNYEPTTLPGHHLAITAVSFARNAARLVTASADRTARVWDLAAPPSTKALLPPTEPIRLAYAGDSILVGSADGAVFLSTGETAIELGRHPGQIAAFATTRDRAIAYTAGLDGTVMRWDLARRAGAALPSQTGRVWSIAVSPDAAWIATGTDGGARISDGHEFRPLAGYTGMAGVGSFSPDGQLVAFTAADGTVRLWRAPSWEPAAVLRGHTDLPVLPTFTPDARQLVTGSWDGSLRVWDLASQTARVLLPPGGRRLRALAMSPDGALVATGGQDRTVRLWDLRSGIGRVLGLHDGEVRQLRFSNDGRTLVSISSDSTARLWDPVSGSSQPLRGHLGYVYWMDIRDDGREIATVSADRTVRRWPVPPTESVPQSPADVRAWLTARTTQVR